MFKVNQRKLEPKAVIVATTAACALAAPLHGGTYSPIHPGDVDLLPSGNILVTDHGSFVGSGSSGVYEIDRDGNIVWASTSGLDWAHNADQLPNGSLIVSDTGNQRVIMIDTNGAIVWTTDGLGLGLSYPNDANRLPNGHVLITDRDDHRVIEITLSGTIVWSYEGLAAGADCTSSGLWGPHNADRLPNGHTIIADSNNDRIIEVNTSGAIEWCYEGALDWPRDADRLANGNTLINDSNHHRIVEVNPGGAAVWEYHVASLMYDSDRLPSGNTLISAEDRLIEVNSCGIVVWEYPPSTTPLVLWEIEIEGEVLGCPVVGPDGDLYLATHKDGGVLYRIRPCDGAVVASNFVPGAVENGLAMGENGLLYLVTQVQALASANPWPAQRLAVTYRAKDLTEVWRAELSRGADTSPIVGTNGRVYLGVVVAPGQEICMGMPPSDAVETCTNGEDCGRYYSFDATTGETHIDMWLEGWAATPGVVNEDGYVFFGVEDLTGGYPAVCEPAEIWPGKFYGLNGLDSPSDATLWSLETNGDFGSPVGYADGVVYTTCRDGHLYGFDPGDGTVVFDRCLDAPSWTGVTIGRDGLGRAVLYTATQTFDLDACSNGIMPGDLVAIAIDGTLEGEVLWSVPIPAGMAWGNAALDDLGYIYAVSAGGPLLRALDPGDGHTIWDYTLPGGGRGHGRPHHPQRWDGDRDQPRICQRAAWPRQPSGR